jgi:hypothetical protein
MTIHYASLLKNLEPPASKNPDCPDSPINCRLPALGVRENSIEEMRPAGRISKRLRYIPIFAGRLRGCPEWGNRAATVRIRLLLTA